MWTDLEQKGNNNNSGSDKAKVAYVKLTPNEVVKLRIVDEQPESRWVHWVQSANKGKGLGIKCPGKGCPLCADMAEKRKAKQPQRYSCSKSHALNVINRGTGKIEVLDKGNKIFESLLNILKQMGDLRNYDITITTTKTGSEATNVTYTVLPTFPPTPLTSAEKEMIERDRYDLKELTKGFTIEQINKLVAGATIEEVTAENPVSDSPVVDFTQAR
jgi:hypothetical protein